MESDLNLTEEEKSTKRKFKLYGRITMDYYEEYDVDVPYFDLKIIENNENPVGYKKLGEYAIYGNQFTVYSWADENNEILKTIVGENLKNTPTLNIDASSYVWECYYKNGGWIIVDYNELPYIVG